VAKEKAGMEAFHGLPFSFCFFLFFFCVQVDEMEQG